MKKQNKYKWPNLSQIIKIEINKPRSLSILIGIIGIIITILLWETLVNREKMHIEQIMEVRSQTLKNEIYREITPRIIALNRMAERWAIRGETPKAEWEADAQNYIKDYQGFQAIEWVDTEYYVRWIVPLIGNQSAYNINLGLESKRLAALKKAQNWQIITASQTINLVQGGKGFLVYVPIFSNIKNQNRKFQGFILGVFRVQQLFDSILKNDNQDYTITIWEDNQKIYIYNNQSLSEVQEKWQQNLEIEIYGAKWQIQIYPTQKLLEKYQSSLPIFVIIAGLITTITISLTVYFAQTAKQRNQQFKNLNKELEKEINYRQITTEKFKKTNTLQQAILDSANYTIISTTTDGIICTFNSTAEKYLGYKAAEVIGKVTPAIIHDKNEIIHRSQELSHELGITIEPSFETFVAKARLGEVDENEWHYIRKDGSRFPVRLSVTAIRDENNEITGFMGIAQDITERKRSEEALEKTLRELAFQKFAVDQAAIVAITDHNGIITYVNDKFCEISQYSKQELIGKTYRTTVKSNYHSSEFFKELWLTITTGKVWQGEIKNQTKNNNYYWIQVTIVPFLNKQGEPFQFLTICFDITKSKEVREELQAQQDKLTEQNLALKIAKKEAETANRAKSEFLAMMSHEIRTPMNAVIGMTGLLLDTNLTLQQQDFVETIRNSGDALLTIINDILDFSKIESDRLDLEEHPFNLRNCIEESLDLLASNAAAKNLDLAYIIDVKIPQFIVTDITRLRQILVNLLGNAVKFTQAGEVVISVTLLNQIATSSKEIITNSNLSIVKSPEILETNENVNLSPMYEIQFAIRDTGIGIPQDRLDRLFKPFSQIDSSMTRQYGGTGLGLAISKRLSELMGGKMWVESEENKGSTFYFTITARSAPDIPVIDLQISQPELTGKRLLVVDDNATNRKIITMQTEFWGMQVDAADSGLQALKWLVAGNKFDIAILDMQMPEMDGLSLATHIHSLANYQNLTLILLSSVGKLSPEKMGYKNEFSAIISKPIKQSQLYNVLISIFNGKGVASSQSYYQPSPVQVNAEFAKTLPLRILLVEDVTLNQKVALQMLQRFGYRADIANNGSEAIDSLRRQPYDLVFMDVQMPVLDGLQATRLICQELSPPNRPWIVAMTAHAMQGDREQCIESGMNDYISKPIRLEHLLQVFNNYKLMHQFSPLISNHNENNNKVDFIPPPDHINLPTPVEIELEANQKPAIDAIVFQELMEMLGENSSLILTQLIDIYMKEAPPLIEAITNAINNSNPTALHQKAHALKSSTVSIGGLLLAEICSKLEAIGRQGSTANTSTLMQELHHEYQRLVTALKAKQTPP